MRGAEAGALTFHSVVPDGVYVNEAAVVRAVLEHLGLPTAGARLIPARGPLQAAWC